MSEERVQHYGPYIRRLRKARRITQAQLGERVGLDQGFISRLENGVFECSVSQLSAIAKALGVTIVEIIGDAVREQGSSYGAAPTDPRSIILANYGAPPGLRDLAQDQPLAEALKITPEEWKALTSLKLPGNVTKEGYLQFLITLRNIMSITQLST
jgi:transcriptional regulator with XRE-family HTH domain